jgi:hypothetical protein
LCVVLRSGSLTCALRVSESPNTPHRAKLHAIEAKSANKTNFQSYKNTIFHHRSF